MVAGAAAPDARGLWGRRRLPPRHQHAGRAAVLRCAPRPAWPGLSHPSRPAPPFLSPTPHHPLPSATPPDLCALSHPRPPRLSPPQSTSSTARSRPTRPWPSRASLPCSTWATFGGGTGSSTWRAACCIFCSCARCSRCATCMPRCVPAWVGGARGCGCRVPVPMPGAGAGRSLWSARATRSHHPDPTAGHLRTHMERLPGAPRERAASAGGGGAGGIACVRPCLRLPPAYPPGVHGAGRACTPAAAHGGGPRGRARGDCAVAGAAGRDCDRGAWDGRESGRGTSDDPTLLTTTSTPRHASRTACSATASPTPSSAT